MSRQVTFQLDCDTHARRPSNSAGPFIHLNSHPSIHNLTELDSDRQIQDLTSDIDEHFSALANTLFQLGSDPEDNNTCQLKARTVLSSVESNSMSENKNHVNNSIDQHFAAKHTHNRTCSDAMAEVRKIEDKRHILPFMKRNTKLELENKISETQTTLEQFSPTVVIDSYFDDEINEVESAILTDAEQDLQSSIVWIRRELFNMRQTDQDLARELISLDLEMQHLRLVQTLDWHSDMLESVAMDATEQKDYGHWCDGQLDYTVSPPVCCRQLGLTPSNIMDRKFSLA